MRLAQRTLYRSWLPWVLSAVCCLLTMFPAHAAIPHLIRYQGQVADNQGVPLEGPYPLTFRLYDAESGGTVVWEETQPNIVLSAGHFTVLLGQVSPFPATLNWSQPLWLAIQVGAEPEFAPRQRITSVPLAIRAEVAERAERLTQAITPSLVIPQGSGSNLDADTVDGRHATDLLNRVNHTGTQPASTIAGTFAPSVIHPQGSGSGLDADTVDGRHAHDLLSRANHTGTQPPSSISPQGPGSGLNADLLDGQDVSVFAVSGHKHSCVNRMGMPGGQTGNGFCAGHGEWCAHNLTAGGRDTESCATSNPGFGDWGAVCCR